MGTGITIHTRTLAYLSIRTTTLEVSSQLICTGSELRSDWSAEDLNDQQCWSNVTSYLTEEVAIKAYTRSKTLPHLLLLLLLLLSTTSMTMCEDISEVNSGTVWPVCVRLFLPLCLLTSFSLISLCLISVSVCTSRLVLCKSVFCVCAPRLWRFDSKLEWGSYQPNLTPTRRTDR